MNIFTHLNLNKSFQFQCTIQVFEKALYRDPRYKYHFAIPKLIKHAHRPIPWKNLDLLYAGYNIKRIFVQCTWNLMSISLRKLFLNFIWNTGFSVLACCFKALKF